MEEICVNCKHWEVFSCNIKGACTLHIIATLARAACPEFEGKE